MDRKGIIAIALCAIVLIAYFPLMSKFSPKPTNNQKNGIVGQDAEQDLFKDFAPQTSEISPINDEETSIDSFPSQETEKIVQEESEESEDSGVELNENIVIQNKNIISVWSNKGAALKSVTLRNYKDNSKTSEMLLINPQTNTHLPLAISKIKILQNAKTIETSLTNKRFRIVANTKDKISFQTTLKSGLQITKNIYLAPDEYHMNMEFIFSNKSDIPITYQYQLIASSGVVYEGEPKLDISSVLGIDKGNGKYKLIKTKLKDLPESNESLGIAWIGNVNKYFASILKPKSSTYIQSAASRAIVTKDGEVQDFMAAIQSNPVALNPQSEERHGYLFFAGPKLDSLLKKYDLQSLLGFGVFAPISNILLKVLNACYSFIPNYGVAILFLTLLVKLILFPLSRKSQMSMFKMQALQPQIEELKKKYKNDKQRMAKAQMELFKKQGANPLGGCLPMVFQMPIFFALFRTLQSAFEMRQAPFTLWIGDLSTPDTLMVLPFTIPFLGNLLNVLPFIMTGASFIQMRLNPKTPSADPQAKMQQKMMSFMPIMFCFILYKMPSGLTLYWTTSTILGICENLFIRQTIKKLKRKQPKIVSNVPRR